MLFGFLITDWLLWTVVEESDAAATPARRSVAAVSRRHELETAGQTEVSPVLSRGHAGGGEGELEHRPGRADHRVARHQPAVAVLLHTLTKHGTADMVQTNQLICPAQPQ